MDFKYKLKNNPIESESFNYFVDYLEKLGITKWQSFIGQPDESDYESPFRLKNIEEAVKQLKEEFDNNKTFFLQVDSDVDGITSAAIFYRYFKDIYPNAKIIYRVHDGKEHGIIFDTIPIEADVVIIPDAGSSQFDEQAKIAATGRRTIVIDHHEMDTFEKVENTIIVNNQVSGMFKNKFLSGAGMVYKLIDAFSQTYGYGDIHKKYMDLAALGIISDMMSSKELDNNYIIYHGLSNIKSPMFKALLEKQSYSVSDFQYPNKIDIAFYITPLINAVVRMGSVEENLKIFEGFIDYDNNDTFNYVYRGVVKNETFYQRIARESYNIRNKQNKVKVDAMEFLDQEVQAKNLHKNTIITVISSKDDDVTLPKSMTGLVAMDFVKKYKKPTLVMRPKSINGTMYYYGSGRCSPVPGFKSFKDILSESGIVEFAAGHASAFGVGLRADRLNELNQYMNDTYGHVDFGSEEIEVDYIFEQGELLNAGMLRSFAENARVYGNGIPEPKFVFKIPVNRHTISLLGSKQDTLKINHGGVSFIQFRADVNMIDEILYSGQDDNDDYDSFIIPSDQNYLLEIVGRSQLNEFRGVKNLQVIIDNIKYKKI